MPLLILIFALDNLILFNYMQLSLRATVFYLMQSSAAIELFKNMRLCGVPANVATYNMIIECCRIFACFWSASAFLSIMLRDGFFPDTLTYTALVKVMI